MVIRNLYNLPPISQHRDTVCDGIFDKLCPEDEEWETGMGFSCIRKGRRCRLPQKLLFDDIADCDNGEDLCFGTNVTLSRSGI